uniref:K Homology domain-containing protein n=2 Tax=Musca domestica TaxID=7370 RepID=A0A1I8ML83_MUSDO
MGDFGGSTAAHNNLNQSQAFAAALQRAKQIAAKIQPNAPPSGGAPAGFKRSHDDSDGGPDVKRFTSPDGSESGHNSNSNMSGGANNPNMSQALVQAAAVAARIAATAGNTCEEQIRLPDSVMNAFYGRGSSDTITHVQGESGCKIQMGQEGDRVITLRGSRDSVTNGRELIQQLANRNGGGNVEVVLTINMPPPGPTGFPPYQEIMIPGTKVGLVIGKGGDTIKQLQEKTGAKMVIIQDGPNQELIKPLRISGEPQKIEMAKQLVLDLIAQKDAQNQQAANARPGMGGMGSNNGPSGGGGGNYNNFGANGGGESLEVFVPKIAVGVVIGKGGDMIRKIQQECGCKLQFIQGKHDEPGDRRCLIQGSRQQVDDAKRMIDGLIENVMQRNRNGNGGAGGGNPSGGNDNGNSNYGYGYGVNHAQQPAREEISFMVPASKCGIVIGRGGETIKLINQQSGAYCEMDRNAVNPPSEKLFKCKGTPEQVEAARQMIAEKINMDLPVISRKSINGGPPVQQQQDGGNQGGYNAADPSATAAAYQQQWAGYGQAGGWGDQAQPQAVMGQTANAAAAGQADYSAQWIEYYKSMGMHREAEMIEQQLKAKQAAAGGAQTQPQAAAPAAAQTTAGGQTQDYSAQWAEYYRSIGKIEEAEAIEKQMKSAQAANAGNSIPGGSAGPNIAPGAPAAPSAGPAAAVPGGGYPQGMTPTQYAQYSQYYAAAAAAGYPQPGGYGGPGAAGGYGAPGGYPGAPQPPGSGPNQGSNNNQKKNDKH